MNLSCWVGFTAVYSHGISWAIFVQLWSLFVMSVGCCNALRWLQASFSVFYLHVTFVPVCVLDAGFIDATEISGRSWTCMDLLCSWFSWKLCSSMTFDGVVSIPHGLGFGGCIEAFRWSCREDGREEEDRGDAEGTWELATIGGQAPQAPPFCFHLSLQRRLAPWCQSQCT